MLELTRSDPEAQQETWLIYYGDVRFGVIAERQPRQYARLAVGLAASIRAAIYQSTPSVWPRPRGAFEVAWRGFLARRTRPDFDEYRRDRAFHAWKQAMWAKGLKLPTQLADGRSRWLLRRRDRS